MIEIRISTDTAEEALRDLGLIAANMLQPLIEQAQNEIIEIDKRVGKLEGDESIPAKADAQSAVEEKPKRRGRPKNPPKTSPDMIVDEPAEVQAQDEADEKAESEATKPAELTHDDLRTAMGGYVKKFGMDAAQADGSLIFKEVLGTPPEGKDKWQLSIVPVERIAEAIAGWEQAAAKNPFDRTPV